ncbi:MAG: WYL domain-containing protein [Spirochaetales bacterium]|jgi:predicted DNA-binding transcriptional regulator YafY|nr:WYL domain-containing protein [Spirochaetales bacterium]
MKTRKTLPKTALPRIYRIDEMIASGSYPSTREIAKAYETSMSSVSRDIDFMKNSLGAPIEYDALRRGYYYSEKTFRLPGSFTTTENIQALGMAKTLLSLYRGTPLYATAQNLIESITAPLVDQKNPDLYENRIVVPPVAASRVEPEIWNTITAGLKENKIITFDYQGTYDTTLKSRRVRPYQLLFDTGAWHLYGYAVERKDIRVFTLSRIKNAALTAEKFTLPPDYDYCSRADGSNFGVFAGQKKRRFRVVFYDESELWVQEKQWAADQLFEKLDDGIIITFTSTQYNKVLEWVLSRGRTAQPLEPAELVREWKTHIKEMKKLAEAL